MVSKNPAFQLRLEEVKRHVVQRFLVYPRDQPVGQKDQEVMSEFQGYLVVQTQFLRLKDQKLQEDHRVLLLDPTLVDLQRQKALLGHYHKVDLLLQSDQHLPMSLVDLRLPVVLADQVG
jgi:hypothetical protein